MAKSATAASHYSQSFLNPTISMLTVSNKFFGVTNIYSVVGVANSTNVVGETYTNTSGALVTVAAGNTTELISDVRLWTDALGSPQRYVYNATNDLNGTSSATAQYSPSVGTVFIRAVGKASNDGATLCFNFVPVWDGSTTNESNQAADLWAVAVTMNGVTPVLLATNAPLAKWPGASKLRLRDVYSTDTSSDGTWLQCVSFNGFIP